MLEQLEHFLVKFTSLSLQSDNIGYGQEARKCLKEAEMDELQRIVKRILRDPRMRSECFRPSFRPMLGQLVSMLVDLFTQLKTDTEIRIRCALILCSICDEKYANDSADFVAFALPGVFAACQKVLLADTTQMKSLEIPKIASKILTNILAVAFSQCDGEMNEKNSRAESSNRDDGDDLARIIAFKRDENWTKMARAKIVEQLSMMLSRMCAHEIDAIRLEAIRIVDNLYGQRIFGDPFDQIAFDTIAILFSDPFPSVKCACRELAIKLRENSNVMESYGLRKLAKCLKTLEKDVKNASSGHNFFTNVANLMDLLGTKLLGRVFASHDFMQHFLCAIIAVVVVDKCKILISAYPAGAAEEEEAGASKNAQISLKYGLKEAQVHRIMRSLDDLPNFEDIFDSLLDQFISAAANLERRISIAFLMYAMMRGAISSSKMAAATADGCRPTKEDVGGHFSASVVDLLKSMDSLVDGDQQQVMDSQIEEVVPANSDATCLVQLLLKCLSTLQFERIPPKVAADALYETLKCCASPNFAIKEAAEQCLEQFSKNGTENAAIPSSIAAAGDQSEFIFANAHRIMFRVSLAARDFALNPRFPLVIGEMVARCADPRMYREVRSAVDDVLFWLDRSDQRRTALLLRALRNYSQAMLRWFPELRPPPHHLDEQLGEEEEEEGMDNRRRRREEDEHYPLISSSITILNRTKHYISSPSLPIQLLVLDILHHSLQFTRNYEDDFLPMVHQNWHGLVRKLGDDQDILNGGGGGGRERVRPMTESAKLVAAKAVEVVESICTLSKDFVFWKIVKEFLPRAVTLLNVLGRDGSNACSTSRVVHQHSPTYRLQCALLESIPTIVKESGAAATDEHDEPLRRALGLYSTSHEVPDEIRRKALDALEKIANFKATKL